LRELLARPFGVLFKGDSFWKTRIPLDYRLITVGDRVTRDHIAFLGRAPPLAFVDFKTKRSPLEAPDIAKYFDEVFAIPNPPGSACFECALSVIAEAAIGFPETAALIEVRGEEDLVPLILPYIKFPERTVVVYGQPDAGVVAYKIELVSALRTAGLVCASHHAIAPLSALEGALRI